VGKIILRKQDSVKGTYMIWLLWTLLKIAPTIVVGDGGAENAVGPSPLHPYYLRIRLHLRALHVCENRAKFLRNL